MGDLQALADRFEEHRPHLRAVAYRMLGSMSEAEDAVQEAWLRLARADTAEVANLGGWLTTVVGRLCLDVLRRRAARRETSLDAAAAHLPEPVVVRDGGALDPEQEAVLADSVGLALLVVLESLSPAERLAFVLHDMFAVPFDRIAPIVGRSPAAAKMMASRARARVRGAPVPDPDRARQREVVDAFLAASRDGDFERLVATLDPDVVLRADVAGGGVREALGAATVAGLALTFARFAYDAVPVLVNGAAGVLSTTTDGEPRSLMAFTITGTRIAAIDIIADPARLAALDLP
jgi:RNA polymerase sigma factor (sigma-70 family)